MSVKQRLIYLPLGGAGEIGMNCYVYGYGPEGKERLIVVDLGVTFGDMDSTPGLGHYLSPWRMRIIWGRLPFSGPSQKKGSIPAALPPLSDG